MAAKDLLVAFPIIGTALAVTFDVGYFYGIDINYFTLFSVTEHVTFALEALPSVIGITLGILTAPLVLDFVTARRRRSEERAPWDRTKAIYKTGPFWVVMTVILGNVLVLWHDPSSWFSWAGFVFLLVFVGCICAFNPGDLSYVSVVAVFGAFGIVAAFCLGLDKGNSYRTYRYSVKMDGTDIKTRVVRAGERGLLFFESPTNALRFVPWTQISGISSTPR
jgi:hypothetical protein